jgi:hypothetical protein
MVITDLHTIRRAGILALKAVSQGVVRRAKRPGPKAERAQFQAAVHTGKSGKPMGLPAEITTYK